MTEKHQELWTIDELGSRVALALSVDYGGQASGRVRDVPDRRTIRYYTTLGLIDRPAQMRGRTALYGRRHLLQLVAIKRLQTQGLTLAELQQQLLGLTDAALEEIARLDVEVVDTSPRPANNGMATVERSAFWCANPAAVSETEPTHQTTAGGSQEISLGAGVVLSFSPRRRLESGDLEAIQAAVGPLLKVLEKRHLL